MGLEMGQRKGTFSIASKRGVCFLRRNICIFVGMASLFAVSIAITLRCNGSFYCQEAHTTSAAAAQVPYFSELTNFQNIYVAHTCTVIALDDAARAQAWQPNPSLQSGLQKCLADTSCNAVAWDVCSRKIYIGNGTLLECRRGEGGRIWVASGKVPAPRPTGWLQHCEEAFCRVPGAMHLIGAYSDFFTTLRKAESYAHCTFYNPSLFVWNSELYTATRMRNDSKLPASLDPNLDVWDRYKVLICKLTNLAYMPSDCFAPTFRPPQRTNFFQGSAFDGFKDPRSIVFSKSIHVVNAVWSNTPHFRAYQVLTKLDSTLRQSESSMAMNCPSLPNPESQKNWMPLVHGNELFFVAFIDPLRLVHVDFTSGECREVPLRSQTMSFRSTVGNRSGEILHGGTPFVEMEPGLYLALVHWSAHDIRGANSHGKRFYVHHFYAIKLLGGSAEMKTEWTWLSDGFRLPAHDIAEKIQFAAGLAYHNDTLFISYGEGDTRGVLVTISNFGSRFKSLLQFGVQGLDLHPYFSIPIQQRKF